MKTRILAILAVVLGVTMLATAPVGATKPHPEHKVTICHAVSGLGKTKNGYNIITVDVASVFTKGHTAHTHEGRHDIIPAFDYKDKYGHVKHYPGLGDASWIATGCAHAPTTTTLVDTTVTSTTVPDTTVTTEDPCITAPNVAECTAGSTTTTVVDTTVPPTTVHPTFPQRPEPSTTTTTVPAPPVTDLPKTGGDNRWLLVIGLLMTLGGMAAVVLTHRGRTD